MTFKVLRILFLLFHLLYIQLPNIYVTSLYLRVTHSSTTTPPVDVYLNGTRILFSVQFGESSKLFNVPDGVSKLYIIPAIKTETGIIKTFHDLVPFLIIGSGMYSNPDGLQAFYDSDPRFLFPYADFFLLYPSIYGHSPIFSTDNINPLYHHIGKVDKIVIQISGECHIKFGYFTLCCSFSSSCTDL